ncbi:CMP-N-acetylneuraminate-beta-1,4-galactoside alpha-2,3-sialyltransferase isoform X1 [Xiphophorus maculatus]|uniref:CMP-N-acetylneuraminate-beta-1,4-galactoside alpha-2,3-sialyltransferase n=1 Tax=Xiphophorus maculatus TaxID=8083 RepID=A0A3B5QSY3_XIPMA|nr:CMP-N-acetylneuraminate-beta-1,4-galactoside alpha-2,3-sialyltransferase isoform X1 [Xiphophorus maculatus]XP_023190910.1 CMP-N-acetylneuraminate-beta-1,4-galactoside alpha-2,3-sialyltransferase isoform X1 [Xiphophorus maculatus]XP_032421158.1 CMP-N-acetylneuraminate-beta-1,4-galactoside alpha-2,3-sialyltransferase isoform X4 [Xiphophorus hellerii]
MKPTHKLLFVLCALLVLGFIYYSSWKLHLYVWGQKPQKDAEETSVALTKGAEVKRIAELENDINVGRIVSSGYDKQGFLLQLETKLPPELAYKYGNLSEGVCKPGYATAKMTSIYPKFVKLAPMFLDRNFKQHTKIKNYPPPFGIKTQERIIDNILTETRSFGLGEDLDSLSCKRCIIVGNGGILYNKSLGSRIDEYDVVVRLNGAPIAGYKRDVGTKTTLRITYPEGAIQKSEHYEGDSLFVFSAFKPIDFKWLKNMVFKEKLNRMEGFWKSVAQHVPRKPAEMRILNPYFIQEAAFQFIGLPFNNGLMGKGNIPTLGTVAITMALHNCDEVAVAGFGYDMTAPQAPLHYYESVKMSAIKESWTHNIAKEKEFLRKLVKANVITDLTKGI